MHSTLEDMLPLLDRIARSLERAPVEEGFADYSKTIYCNLTKGNGDGWYSLEGKEATTLPPLFRGRILRIEFPTLNRNGKDVRKLHLLMRAGSRIFTFESGYDSFFSKTILAACAVAATEVLSQPIQLATYAKQLNVGGYTLAVSLRTVDGMQMNCSWSNDDDWRALSQAAILNVNAANARF